MTNFALFMNVSACCFLPNSAPFSLAAPRSLQTPEGLGSNAQQGYDVDEVDSYEQCTLRIFQHDYGYPCTRKIYCEIVQALRILHRSVLLWSLSKPRRALYHHAALYHPLMPSTSRSSINSSGFRTSEGASQKPCTDRKRSRNGLSQTDAMIQSKW